MRLGAHSVVDPNATDPAAGLQALAGVDPEVVFECAGVKGTINAAVLLAGARGRVVVLGVCAETDEVFPMIGIMKELEVEFALAHSRDEFTEALEALRTGRIDVAPLVTETSQTYPKRSGRSTARPST